MARPIDRALASEEPDSEPSLSGSIEGGCPTHPTHRIGLDAIDFAYYTRQAHKRHARYVRLWLRAWIGCVVSFLRQRSVERALRALDERSLRDIGIAQADIPAIASGAYMQDISRRQRGVRDCPAKESPGRCPSTALSFQHPSKEDINMNRLFSEAPRKFAQHWIDAWNRHDLDAVLTHFSDDFEFSSPLIRHFADEPSGKLIGKDAVRAYWKNGLTRLPDLHFELVDVLAGVNCLTILYRGHRGLAAEVLQIGSDGLAVRGQALYAAEE
ncbi:MAG: nuclear transport factor 2 family protein [Pseudomonadota bacterium]